MQRITCRRSQPGLRSGKCDASPTYSLTFLCAFLLRFTLAGLHAEEAHLAISDIVAARKPERFGAHVQLELNHPRHLDGSFEPVTFNRRFELRGGGPSHALVANAHVFDTMKDGYLDGAEAWIYRFDFADSAESPQSGDLAFVRAEWFKPPIPFAADRLRAFFGDTWTLRGTRTGSFERDPTTTAPTNGGRSSLKLTISSAQELLVESQGQFDGSYQGFYPTLTPGRTCRLRFWAKTEGPLPRKLEVNLTSVYQGLRKQATLGTSWQEHSAEFVAPPWLGVAPVSVCQLHLTGPGSVWIDNLTIQEIGTEPYAPDGEQLTALKEFAPGSMRTFGAFNDSQTLTSWTDLPQLTTVIWSINNGGNADDGDKLPVLLDAASQSGASPWLVVGGQITEEEWTQLIEYLAAPFDPATGTAASKPWAAKRHTQGRTTPWTEAFPTIRLEFCNEAWNYLFPYSYDAVTYGRLARYFFSRAKTSPWWDESKFEFVLNGWLLQPGTDGYGATARRQVQSAQGVGVTAYVGGWERGQFVGGSEFNDLGVQDTLLYAAYDQVAFHRIHAETRRRLTAEGFPYRLVVYEAGPGYSLPNGGRPFIPVQERYGKSLAAGVCTLDMLLFNALLGYGAQNYFTSSYGFNWSSHALKVRGGHPYPAWSALQLRNRYWRGDLVASSVLSCPATDVIRTAEGYDVRHIPLVQPYAFFRFSVLGLAFCNSV